jgi:thiol-disulfide isomerase/thioredoxin
MQAQQPKAYLRATIENRNSDTLFILSPRYNFGVSAYADDAGVFNFELEITPGVYQIYDGKEWSEIFLKPGYRTFMATDARQFDEKLTFSGSGANENNILARFTLNEEIFNAAIDSLRDDPTTLKNLADTYTEKIRTALRNKNIDQSFREYITHALSEQESRINDKIKTWSMEGKPSPDFSYKNYQDNAVHLKDFKGKYVYIDVWATWCTPCLAQMPFLEQLTGQYENKGIAFVSISIDGDLHKKAWENFINTEKPSGIQLISGKGMQSAFMEKFKITSVPHYIIIDREGNVVNADAPRPDDPKLKIQLNALLDTP